MAYFGIFFKALFFGVFFFGWRHLQATGMNAWDAAWGAMGAAGMVWTMAQWIFSMAMDLIDR